MIESANIGSPWPAIQTPLVLSTSIVHVVRVNLDQPADEWMRMEELLSDDEQSRAARFRFDEPRRRFITCRATLRLLLGGCCGVSASSIPIRYGENGKPGLSFENMDVSTPRVEFSVSHSRELGLIALTIGSPVGVDIEECNPKVSALKLAERFFAPQESAELSNLAPEKQLAGFYRGWTCKEAYIKAIGRGLSVSLSSFCMVIDPDHPAALRHVDGCPNESALWTIQSLDVHPNYAAAVMVANPGCQIVCVNWLGK